MAVTQLTRENKSHHIVPEMRSYSPDDRRRLLTQTYDNKIPAPITQQSLLSSAPHPQQPRSRVRLEPERQYTDTTPLFCPSKRPQIPNRANRKHDTLESALAHRRLPLA